jgi:tetratricopeptide (TPR) repeat protein
MFNRAGLRSAVSAGFQLQTDQSLLVKGQRAYQMNHFSDAIEYFSKHIEVYNLFLISFLFRLYDVLIFYLKKLNPFDLNGFIGKGKSLDKINYHQEAIKSYDIAIQLNPNNPVPLNYKGKSLHALNKYQEAIKIFDSAINLDPKYDEAYYSKGMHFISPLNLIYI